MKIVLSLDEACEIIAEHLVSNGKLENKPADVHWHVLNGNAKESYVEFEQ